ncbi:MAG: radical SAM protein, partial [Gemmatimonadota bacterium]
MSGPLVDRLGRPLGNLRLSVTDRCNMRCRYCMPEEDYLWLPRSSLLSFEELTRLATIFQGLGVRRIRLTGGEPLLRHGLPDLVRMLAASPVAPLRGRDARDGRRPGSFPGLGGHGGPACRRRLRRLR